MKTETFDDVRDAIEATTPEQAASCRLRRLRSKMMMAIVDAVRSWNVTQAVAARRLGITQPRLDQLLKGRLSEFSLSALTDLAAGAGIGVTVRLQRARKPAADRSAASPPTTIRADELATMLLEHFRPASDFVA